MNNLTEPMDEVVAKQVGSMQRPIPGQSLTNDPDNPSAYEKPPTFTSLNKAQEAVFVKLIDEEIYVPVMSMLSTGEATIMELTQNILYAGFRSGKWNPDLMLLLAEPTAYMLMGLAERAGIDYEIDDEIDEEEELNNRTSSLQEAFNKKSPQSKKIPSGAIPKNIEERLDEAPVESLLAPQQPQEEIPVSTEDTPLEIEQEASLLGAQ